MPAWNDHQMTVVVGVTVQDHGVMGSAKEDEVAFVFFVAKERTKKAAGSLSGARAQVGLAPRGPHSVHRSLQVHGFLDGTAE